MKIADIRASTVPTAKTSPSDTPTLKLPSQLGRTKATCTIMTRRRGSPKRRGTLHSWSGEGRSRWDARLSIVGLGTAMAMAMAIVRVGGRRARKRTVRWGSMSRRRGGMLFVSIRLRGMSLGVLAGAVAILGAVGGVKWLLRLLMRLMLLMLLLGVVVGAVVGRMMISGFFASMCSRRVRTLGHGLRVLRMRVGMRMMTVGLDGVMRGGLDGGLFWLCLLLLLSCYKHICYSVYKRSISIPY